MKGKKLGENSIFRGPSIEPLVDLPAFSLTENSCFLDLHLLKKESNVINTTNF